MISPIYRQPAILIPATTGVFVQAYLNYSAQEIIPTASTARVSGEKSMTYALNIALTAIRV